mmetsp:Transcript_71793/g.142458  ORF Transcript_71793/g.142458 Transcript_71793/m.142458 type:complete len:262 (-) Transcript_71793:133-918(-)
MQRSRVKPAKSSRSKPTAPSTLMAAPLPATSAAVSSTLQLPLSQGPVAPSLEKLPSSIDCTRELCSCSISSTNTKAELRPEAIDFTLSTRAACSSRTVRSSLCMRTTGGSDDSGLPGLGTPNGMGTGVAPNELLRPSRGPSARCNCSSETRLLPLSFESIPLLLNSANNSNKEGCDSFRPTLSPILEEFTSDGAVGGGCGLPKVSADPRSPPLNSTDSSGPAIALRRRSHDEKFDRNAMGLGCSSSPRPRSLEGCKKSLSP